MILENVTNRKLLAFIVGMIVGLALAFAVLFIATEQFVGTLPYFLTYFAGILGAFVTANVVEDSAKAKYAAQEPRAPPATTGTTPSGS